MYKVSLTIRGVTHNFTVAGKNIKDAEYRALDQAEEMYDIRAYEWDEIETIYIGPSGQKTN